MNVDLALPSIGFDNRTEYDALQFDTIDQNGVGFHVIVAKVGYKIGPAGDDGRACLVRAPAAAPLHLADVHFDVETDSSVRYESDLAPYKPVCDVVVVGTAHAPGDQELTRFKVALHVQLPDVPAPLPEPPVPLNPLQQVSFAARQKWQSEVDLAHRTAAAGAYVISKVLTVTGPRTMRHHTPSLYGSLMVATAGTLKLVGFSPWYMTRIVPTKLVPMRYEHAQGGQCAVYAGSPAAARVPSKHRLSANVAKAWEGVTAMPIALDACQANPVGTGYAPSWYVKAARIENIPGPQIEYEHEPFEKTRFPGGAKNGDALIPAGFGFVGRAWLPRRSYIGNISADKTWGENEVPQLPKDFDFRYWNGAPVDQQCPYLLGNERVTLVNMSTGKDPSVTLDAKQNAHLRFTVPTEVLYLLGQDQDGAIATVPLSIDTMVIDTDVGTVDLTYRTSLLADGALIQVRLLSASTPDQLARLQAWQEAADPKSYPEVQPQQDLNIAS